MNLRSLRGMAALAFLMLLILSGGTRAAEPPAEKSTKLFDRDNLVAWCIVPFDAKKRSPEERAAMLKRLGFKRYAYDWRAEHLPTFEREIAALKENGIELTAIWFPANLGTEARTLLATVKKHGIKTQLWITMGDPGGKEQKDKVEAAAKVIRPIAEEAEKLGCTVALYNHGGWFGEPENQIAIINQLKLKNVGIVYNLHHGHDHLARFPELLKRMQPHLLALNLNGMVTDGEKLGKKIMPLGQGDLDLGLLKTIRDSGYSGPIGILGHTQDDAEERLRDNLDGLDWLVPQLAGKPAGPKPKPRTLSAAPAPAPTGGWIAEGKAEYRMPPITVECRVKLMSKGGFNVVVASDTKASAAHWELFTMGGSGHFCAYLPGMKPDHARSEINICDQQWHTIAMQYETERVRLFVDGKMVADQQVKRDKNAEQPGGIAFARLVEGGIGCDGELDRVRITRGIVPPTTKELTAKEATLGLWTFTARGKPAEDATKTKNTAKPIASATPAPLIVPAGPNLTPTDAKLKATLLDRSEDDAYMAVKADSAGRLFVGGREKVFVFETDGSGGFRPRIELLHFPQDSIIIGLEFRGNDLYVLAAHGLYLVPEGRVKRTGLNPKRILWGVPLDFHVSFHCMAWGPEGDLYLDHGDPLLGYGDWTRPDHWAHWTLFAGPKGEKVSYTGAGAVLKVRPDGSNPRVVARGLRGPVGLAFDSEWNLFTNDNDHESQPDRYAPIRLLHVVPRAEFSWPRGWMASKRPDRADLLDSLHPALGRGVPCDLAFYQEPTIPGIRGNLLMCRWDRFAITQYPLVAEGSSFTTDELTFAQGTNQCRPTGIAIDPVGRIFVTSHYLGGNVVTPHCPSDLTMIAPVNAATPRFRDEADLTAEELWAALSSPSWGARCRAHQEWLRRGVPADVLSRLATVRTDDPAAAHLPWLAASIGTRAAEPLIALAGDASKPQLRLQALRALAAFPKMKAPASVFVDALAEPRLAVAGLEGLYQSTTALPIPAIAKLAGGTDTTLRQLAATLLAARATPDELAKLIASSDASMRLAGVLAVGTRLTVPAPNAPPPPGVKLHFPAKSAFFSPELHFADSPTAIDLTTLAPIGSYTTAMRWAGEPHTPEQERLFALLIGTLDDSSDLVVSQTAYYLGWLRDPRSEQRVARSRLELRTRGVKDRPPVALKEVWLIGRFADPASGLAIERGPIDLSTPVVAGTGRFAWQATQAKDGKIAIPGGSGAVYGFVRIQSRDRQPALVAPGLGSVAVWHNGRAVAAEADGSMVLDLQPGSNDLLIRTTGTAPLELTLRARGGISMVMPDQADGAVLAARLKEAQGAAAVPPEFLKLDWSTEGRNGNPDRGRKLFETLGCAKCHAITPDQSGGGAPSLVDAGKRFTPAHLAESILLPDRQVADEFRASRISTTDGKVLVGLVVRESPTEIEVLLPDTTRQVLKAADVESRKPVATSAMPAGLVKTPDELRDLLAYLTGNRP